MENVKIDVKGNIMTIVVDLSIENGISSSGKSITIASTKGNKDIGGVKVGLNVYRPVS